MKERKKFFNRNLGSTTTGAYVDAWEMMQDSFGDIEVLNNRGRVLAEFWGL